MVIRLADVKGVGGIGSHGPASHCTKRNRGGENLKVGLCRSGFENGLGRKMAGQEAIRLRENQGHRLMKHRSRRGLGAFGLAVQGLFNRAEPPLGSPQALPLTLLHTSVSHAKDDGLDLVGGCQQHILTGWHGRLAKQE